MLRPSLIAALCLMLPLAQPASAAASTSGDAVAALNQVRAQVGVPPVVDHVDLASDCATHVSWMERNAMLSHPEPAGSDTPTAAGNDAGLHSVLAYITPSLPMTNVETIPWLRGSPLHLFQILQPALATTGYAFSNGYSCLVSSTLALRPVVSLNTARGRGKVFTWPHNGAVLVPSSEDTSREVPSPNVRLGLPRTKITGPYLLVFANGFGASPSCAGVAFSHVSLTGPAGPVAVRYWDDVKARAAAQVPRTACGVPSGGGHLVPEQPLQPNTTYTASVSVKGIGAPAMTPATVRTWSFSTGATLVDRSKPLLRIQSNALRTRLGRFTYNIRVRVADQSATTCVAVVARRRVACRVVRGVVVLVGRRVGTPRAIGWSLVVRDVRGYRSIMRSTARRVR